MSTPLLSINIPITPDRLEGAQGLLKKIGFQFGLMHFANDEWITQIVSEDGVVELVMICDNKIKTIGEKREELYKLSKGKYLWQVDSDDNIADNAIELILEAIKQQPDCITFQEKCIIDGVEFKSNHSHEYPDWDGDGQKIFSDGFHYHRTPFFKSVIKTSIAQSVPIQHIRFSEDHYWARDLKPHLHSEIHIPEDLYIYQHQSSDFNERYGIK